jgi:hypothetical protein
VDILVLILRDLMNSSKHLEECGSTEAMRQRSEQEPIGLTAESRHIEDTTLEHAPKRERLPAGDVSYPKRAVD